MSLILEALRRADSERSTAPASGRGDTHSHDTRMRRPLPMTTLVLINLTVFLAGAALAMWLLRSVLGLTAPAPTATAAAATPVPALAKPAAHSRPATKPASPPPAQIQSPPPQTTAAAVAPTSASVENPVDRTPPSASTTPGVPEPATETETETDSSVDPDAYASLDDIAPLYASPYDASSDWQPEAGPGTTPSRAAQRSPTPTLDPAAFAAALAQQPAAGTEDNAPTHSEPQLRDMPAAYRAQFPSLTIQVHVYDDDPQRRWVLIDGRRYGEGSTLEAGPELVSIEADGIVLSFRGESIWWPLQR